MPELQIGNVKLENDLILGPMAGVTDRHFVCFAKSGSGVALHGDGQRERNYV